MNQVAFYRIFESGPHLLQFCFKSCFLGCKTWDKWFDLKDNFN